MKEKVIKFFDENRDEMFGKFVNLLERRDGLSAEDEEKMITLESALNEIDALIDDENFTPELFEKRMNIQRELALMIDPGWLRRAGLSVDENGNLNKLSRLPVMASH